jgi:hypothetical protein
MSSIDRILEESIQAEGKTKLLLRSTDLLNLYEIVVSRNGECEEDSLILFEIKLLVRSGIMKNC